MKKHIFCIIFCLSALFLLTACGKDSSGTTPGTTPAASTDRGYTVTFSVGGQSFTQKVLPGELPVFSGSTERPSDGTHVFHFIGWDREIVPASEDTTYTAQYEEWGTAVYNIRWIVEDGVITTTAHDGELPASPEVKDVTTESEVITFTGWNREIVRADGDAIYEAEYSREPRKYTVTYRVDGETFATTESPYGAFPVLPATEPPHDGFAHLAWVGSQTKVVGEMTCDAFPCDSDPTAMAIALAVAPLSYVGANDNNEGNAMASGSALIMLLLEERTNARGGEVKDVILLHLRSLIAGGHEPHFDAKPYWNYPVVTAALALAKATPSVWSQLTEDEIARLDCLMRAFTYLCAFCTDDDNNYLTGPRLTGNYKKIWNPNYRLANVPQIIFCTSYFGGADATNALIADFDYDRTIAEFQAFGFSRALASWTTPGFELPDGTTAPGAKELLMNGGEAYYLSTAGTPAGGGSGVGVRSNGSYTYQGKTLSELPLIFNALMTYTYSGGEVTNDCVRDGTTWAYTLNGGVTPVLGLPGMMLEFNTGDGNGARSSASYCAEDLAMVVSALAVMRELGQYRGEDYPTVFSKVWVGNTDTVYKLRYGYHSYSTGHGYDVYGQNCDPGIRIFMAYWDSVHGDLSYKDKLVKEIINPAVLLDFSVGGKGSTDMTHNLGTSADKVVGTKNWLENDYIVEFSVRLDEDFSGFNIRLRSTKRNDAGNRMDLIQVQSNGTIMPVASIFTPIGDAPASALLQGYGWHRIAVRYRQAAVADDAAQSVLFTATFTITLDGVEIGSYAGDIEQFRARGWLLFGANYDATAENHMVYTKETPKPDGTLKSSGTTNNVFWQIFRPRFYNQGEDVYHFVELRDIFTSCGKVFYFPVTAPVSYDLAGGAFAESDTVETKGGYAESYDGSPAVWFYTADGTLTLETPVREGYSFRGWFDNADCTGEPITAPDLTTGRPLTFYAGWMANS